MSYLPHDRFIGQRNPLRRIRQAQNVRKGKGRVLWGPGLCKFLAMTYSRPKGLPSAAAGLASVFGMANRLRASRR